MRNQLLTVIESVSRLAAILTRKEGAEGQPVLEMGEYQCVTEFLADAKSQLQANPRYFDNVRFSTALKNCIGDRPLREVAVEVGVSISTLSRLTRGNIPDIDTFATVCYWMGCLPMEFFATTKPI